MLTEQEILNCFSNIRVWKKGDQRAPHKPLLVLLMLGRLQRKEPRLVSYAEVGETLQNLLDDFGPPRKSTPAYPFYHLSNDGIWDFVSPGKLKIIGSPSSRCLLDNDVYGGFSEEIYAVLLHNPGLIKVIAWKLLKKNFPDTLHTEILQEIGLDIETRTSELEVAEGRVEANTDYHSRYTNFRERVLIAYSFKCAVCGFNVWLGRIPVALEAAHIKWYQAGGPDQENNGLLLCALHHKLFDRGAFSIDENFKIRVSEMAHGGEGFEECLAKFHGQPIRIPERPQYKPKENYIAWHLKEVFRGPAKYSAG